MQNSPARLPDVGLGPRVGLPGRRQPAGYGTSWPVLVSGTGGRSGSSEPNLFSPFPSTNLNQLLASSVVILTLLLKPRRPFEPVKGAVGLPISS